MYSSYKPKIKMGAHRPSMRKVWCNTVNKKRLYKRVTHHTQKTFLLRALLFFTCWVKLATEDFLRFNILFNILTGSNYPDEWFLKHVLLLFSLMQLENIVTEFSALMNQM
jgi:hypothetical protein